MTEALNPFEPSYWKNLKLSESDLDSLSSHLLEKESPATVDELAEILIQQHIERFEASSNGTKGPAVPYLPEGSYQVGQALSFSHLDGTTGTVSKVRAAQTLPGQHFKAVQVEFDDGKQREYAAELAEHALNDVPEPEPEEEEVDPVAELVAEQGGIVAAELEASLQENADFVYIAGRWFLKALTSDFSEGQLNLAEAVLDMIGGGPLSTEEILKEVGGPEGIHPNLASFSLDLALQDDERFDEVGTAGVVAWFLQRLEPKDVLETPLFLRYEEIPVDRSKLTPEMLELEEYLYDELSPISAEPVERDEVEIRLIFPHWRSGSLPLTKSLEKLFPTAYESPRVRFEFVDKQSGKRYPGWVVRNERYIDGLRKWYTDRELMPGSYVKARRGDTPGEIIVDAQAHHSSKEWVRTALIGADGGVVYAMLKQPVQCAFDDRMMVYLPSDISVLDKAWESRQRNLDQVVFKSVRDLAKLSPQQHAHASEIYAAVNVVKRCPPGPILALLLSHPEIEEVGHLHFRIKGEHEEG